MSSRAFRSSGGLTRAAQEGRRRLAVDALEGLDGPEGVADDVMQYTPNVTIWQES
jgi:hypothetical protein